MAQNGEGQEDHHCNRPGWSKQAGPAGHAPKLTDQLVVAITNIEKGLGAWPPAALFGHIMAVEKTSQPMGPKDFRPITVLSLPCRTWATIRAKQCLAWLDKWAPAGLKGNRPFAVHSSHLVEGFP